MRKFDYGSLSCSWQIILHPVNLVTKETTSAAGGATSAAGGATTAVPNENQSALYATSSPDAQQTTANTPTAIHGASQLANSENGKVFSASLNRHFN